MNKHTTIWNNLARIVSGASLIVVIYIGAPVLFYTQLAYLDTTIAIV